MSALSSLNPRQFINRQRELNKGNPQQLNEDYNQVPQGSTRNQARYMDQQVKRGYQPKPTESQAAEQYLNSGQFRNAPQTTTDAVPENTAYGTRSADGSLDLTQFS